MSCLNNQVHALPDGRVHSGVIGRVQGGLLIHEAGRELCTGRLLAADSGGDGWFDTERVEGYGRVAIAHRYKLRASGLRAINVPCMDEEA